MLATLLAAVLLLSSSAIDKPLVAVPARVRATGAAMPLLELTAAGSPTVRALLSRLAETDVIVYIEITSSPQVTVARTKLVTATPTARFLRIGISSTLRASEMPPLIAHELQHALEIAEQADVKDDAGVRRLYARIGHEHGIDNFETDAARAAERRAREEMARIAHP